MSFTRDVKLELGMILPATEHCRRAQLSGVFFGAGVFELGAGSHFAVRVSLSLPAIARRTATCSCSTSSACCRTICSFR